MTKVKNNEQEYDNKTAKNDSIFKAIMLENPHILKAILETLFKRSISHLEILNSELSIEQFLEKGKRLDIYLKADETFIDVEVSRNYDEFIQNRNLTYLVKVYYQSVRRGTNYRKYKQAISYNIIWGKDNEEYWEISKMRTQHGKTISDMFIYHALYMDKFMMRYYNKDIEFIKKYKYLIMLGLQYQDIPELLGMIGGDEIMEDFAKVLEKIVNDEDFGFISKEQDEMMLRNSYLEEGLEKRSKEIAINLMEQGLSLDSISKATGLSQKELINLK